MAYGSRRASEDVEVTTEGAICAVTVLLLGALSIGAFAGHNSVLDQLAEAELRDAAETAVRGAKVDAKADGDERARYAHGLYSWIGGHRFDSWCTEQGFLSREKTAVKCFQSGDYRVADTGYEIKIYREQGQVATKLNPYVGDANSFRYVDINKLVAGAK